MTALTKADMADYLTGNVGLSKREAKDFVELMFEEIRSALARGEEVKLSGFGNFELHDKSERPGRNPKTGEEVTISARRVVAFKAGQKLKSRVENYAAGQDSNTDGGAGQSPFKAWDNSSNTE